jgi:hypothetical protein
MGIFVMAATPKGVFIGTALDAPGALKLAESLGDQGMTDIKVAERGQNAMPLEEFQAIHARPWPYRAPPARDLAFGPKR